MALQKFEGLTAKAQGAPRKPKGFSFLFFAKPLRS
jgi:hypothetical protein